jgi:cob(I)alamin adenosyltransferase
MSKGILPGGVMKRKKGFVHVYTGIGGGKTTSTLGVALRSVGHRCKVIMIQFMKGRKDIGEYKAQKRLKPYFEIHQFGRKEFINLKNPEKIDYELARKGLEFAKKALKKKPCVLILDEINLAVAVGLLKSSDVLEVLKDVPEKTTVYLTGRYAPRELIERADLVTEIIDIKRPKNIPVRKGIEY